MSFTFGGDPELFSSVKVEALFLVISIAGVDWKACSEAKGELGIGSELFLSTASESLSAGPSSSLVSACREPRDFFFRVFRYCIKLARALKRTESLLWTGVSSTFLAVRSLRSSVKNGRESCISKEPRNQGKKKGALTKTGGVVVEDLFDLRLDPSDKVGHVIGGFEGDGDQAAAGIAQLQDILVHC